MNKNLGIGLGVAIALLMVINFPQDTVTLLENLWDIIVEIWDAVRNLLRAFV